MSDTVWSVVLNLLRKSLSHSPSSRCINLKSPFNSFLSWGAQNPFTRVCEKAFQEVIDPSVWLCSHVKAGPAKQVERMLATASKLPPMFLTVCVNCSRYSDGSMDPSYGGKVLALSCWVSKLTTVVAPKPENLESRHQHHSQRKKILPLNVHGTPVSFILVLGDGGRPLGSYSCDVRGVGAIMLSRKFYCCSRRGLMDILHMFASSVNIS